MIFDAEPISPNEGQQNFDKLSNTILDHVAEKMGILQDSKPTGRPFLRECSLNGYDGVVVRDGQIVSLVDLDQRPYIPILSLGSVVTIEGDSRGYVSSGHKPGDRVTVIKFIEPFYNTGDGVSSSNKIIKVEGEGVIGWIKPSEFDKVRLLRDQEEEMKKLFERLENKDS